MLSLETRKKLEEIYQRVTEGDLSDCSNLSMQIFVSKIDILISKEVAERKQKSKEKK